MMRMRHLVRVRKAQGAVMVWSALDQAASAASNLVLFVAVARVAVPRELGIFSLLYLAHGLAIGLARAAVGDACVVEFGLMDAGRATMLRAARRYFFRLAIVSTTSFLAVGALMGEGRNTAFAFAAVQVPVCVAEATRYVCFARGRVSTAAVLDASWLTAALALIIGWNLLGTASIEMLIIAWGMAAIVGIAISLRTPSSGWWDAPAPDGGAIWGANFRTRTFRYGIDYVLSSGLSQASFALAALVVSIEGLAIFRGALVAFSFVTSMFGVGRTMFLRSLSRHATPSRATILPGLALAAALSAAVLVWLGCLTVLPDSLGRQILGATWTESRRYLVVAALIEVCRASMIPAIDHVRRFGAAKHLVPVRAVSGLAMCVGVVGGGAWGGLSGVLLGTLAVQLGAAALWWGTAVWMVSTARRSASRNTEGVGLSP